jgi:hypothetical protein
MSGKQDPKEAEVSARKKGDIQAQPTKATTSVAFQLVPIGQVKANPKNPRVLRDEKFLKLKASLNDFPDMLNYRAIVAVTDTDGKYMALGGNMRLRALQELVAKEVPIMLADHWTAEQRDRFTIADNVGFGEWDWDQLANEWDIGKLEEWGLSKELSALKNTYEMMNGKFDGTKIDYPVTIILDAEEFRMWKKMKEKIGKKTDNEAFFALSNAYFEALIKEVK